jgi:chromate transporter
MAAEPGAQQAAAVEPVLQSPASPAQMFWVFSRLALQGFGGVLPVAQRELVERVRWVSRGQFLEMLSLAQVLPGPNVVNLSLMVGDRFFGWRGALASCAGMLLFPLVIVVALAAVAEQTRHLPAVAGALRGMALVAGGQHQATAVKLGRPLLAPGPKATPLGAPALALGAMFTVLLVAALRWPLVAVIAALGSAGFALAWWRIGVADRAAAHTADRESSRKDPP